MAIWKFLIIAIFLIFMVFLVMIRNAFLKFICFFGHQMVVIDPKKSTIRIGRNQVMGAETFIAVLVDLDRSTMDSRIGLLERRLNPELAQALQIYLHRLTAARDKERSSLTSEFLENLQKALIFKSESPPIGDAKKSKVDGSYCSPFITGDPVRRGGAFNT
jgi:hypothetical protein